MKHPEKISQAAPLESGSLEKIPGIHDVSQVYTHRRSPDAIVRFSSVFDNDATIDDKVAIEKATSMDPKSRTEEALQNLRQARELFKELEEKYGVKNAGFAPAVVAHNTYETGEMVVSKKIDGRFPADPEDNPEEPPFMERELPAARRLFTRLNTYLQDKRESGAPILADVSEIRNYVYENEKDEFTLTDMSPIVSTGGDKDCDFFAYGLEKWAIFILEPDEFLEWQQSAYPVNNQHTTAA